MACAHAPSLELARAGSARPPSRAREPQSFTLARLRRGAAPGTQPPPPPACARCLESVEVTPVRTPVTVKGPLCSRCGPETTSSSLRGSYSPLVRCQAGFGKKVQIKAKPKKLINLEVSKDMKLETYKLFVRKQSAAKWELLGDIVVEAGANVEAAIRERKQKLLAAVKHQYPLLGTLKAGDEVEFGYWLLQGAGGEDGDKKHVEVNVGDVVLISMRGPVDDAVPAILRVDDGSRPPLLPGFGRHTILHSSRLNPVVGKRSRCFLFRNEPEAMRAQSVAGHVRLPRHRGPPTWTILGSMQASETGTKVSSKAAPAWPLPGAQLDPSSAKIHSNTSLVRGMWKAEVTTVRRVHRRGKACHTSEK
eukprot:SM000277S10341  [mRNA]  locus=s277:70113:73690:- [translate_table: standard]